MPGAEYELQRLGDAGFTPDAPWEWVPLLSLQATGLVSSAIDQVPTNVQQRFYRVALLGPGTNDTQAPLVEFEGGEILNGPDQSTRLTLTFLATDDTGVESVTVLEGTNVLGEATTTNGSEWVFVVPADLQAPQTRYFSAKARDGSGKVGQSDPVGLLTLNPDMFAPVGSIGEVLERQALVVTGGNHIAEFIFRPGGRPRPGFAPDFYLRFPDGATRANTTGSVVTVEFVRVVGEFDPESPFRLDAPLVRDAGPTLQLPLGPLGFTNLVTLFGLDPTNGVPLTVFDRFRLRWRGGTLDDRGLVGAQFHSDMRDLPLPDWSAGFANYLVDFSRERVLRVPFTGMFALPDKLKYPAWVGIPPGRPMWLALRSDGAVKIEGPAELMLSTNLNIRAQLRFDEPVYDLTLSPPALRYAGLTNLSPVLPADPGQCDVLGAPGTTWQCLQTLRRAYGSFAAAVSDCATSAPPTELPLPDYVNPAADVLEAWSFNALSRGSHTQPYDYVDALVAQAGIQAGASPELLEVMAIRVALLRSYRAMRAINAPSASFEVVSNALWQAETAAMARADDVAAGLRLDTIVRVARLAAEADDLRRTNELPNTPFDTTTLPQMFMDLANQLAATWNVTPGVFEPDNNPTINSLDRHTAMAALRQVVEFRQHANTLAIPLNTTPIAELSGQLGVRAVHAVEAAMNQADFAEEFPAFALAAREYLELSQWMADGLLPDIPALVWLKNGSRLSQLQTRLARLFELNMQRSARPSSLGRSVADLRVFLAVERSLNFTNTLDKSLLQKLHERLATNLVSRPVLSESNLVHLLERLETGNLNDELARKFQLTRFADWTDIVMPTLVTQICVVAKPLRAWRELDAATELMLEAADHNRTPLGPSGTYLSPTADLLRAARDVARGLMNDSANSLRREDFVLPGDAELYDPAGYVFYNRLSGQLHGAVRGRLRLPTFGLDLTVPNASIDSGGAFDLSARPFTAEFLTNRMNEAEATLNGIIGLTDWAGQFLTNDTVTITNLQFALTNLTITFNSIAEAQKAWWLVDRYQETLRRHAADYGTNSVAALDKTLRDVRASTLYTGRRINDALNTLLGQVQFKDVLVTLPGEVEVRYVNGRLYYDRQRQFMEGCFGGRLEFPQVNTNMFFEIKQACLASDGSFSLISTNATPIPLGGVRVALGMNVQGSPAGIATFQGAGTLWVPNGAASDRVFSLAANYDQQARHMSLEAQGQNLSLPFGQDFVLFDAGFGLDVSQGEPNGRFHAGGSAGLIARDHSHPLPPNPGPG